MKNLIFIITARKLTFSSLDTQSSIDFETFLDFSAS